MSGVQTQARAASSSAGDYKNPITLAKWLYANANPVMYADPSGLHVDYGVENYRDLTDWLYREMVTNAKGGFIRNLASRNAQALRNIAFGESYCQPHYLMLGYIEITSTLLDFKNAVKDQGKWDFKDEIGRKLGPGITLCSYSYCRTDIEYSVAGNVHFSYIGEAAGFQDVVIKLGAGFAEITDPSHNSN